MDQWLHDEFTRWVDEERVPVMRSWGTCYGANGFEGFFSAGTTEEWTAFMDNWDLRDGLSRAFISEVKRERPAVEVRIQMRFPEVFAEIDRLKVESELRMSIFWPLILLTGLLAWAWSPLVLPAALIAPLLLRDAFDRAHEASEKTWGAVMAGEITSPLLDTIASATEQECRALAERFPLSELQGQEL